MAEPDKPLEGFKVPHLASSEECSVDAESSNIPSESDCGKEKCASKSEGKNKVDVPLPYKLPTWSGSPPSLYSFEIIKNGTIVENYNIGTSVVVFGRLDVCNIVFEHPSVSRYHAVVQYCQGDPEHPRGFYVYDLGSTHGTFLNKEKMTPKVYYKLKPGYVLKFGGSTRLHIFQGPDEDENVEEKETCPEVEETCNWGIGEDAEEEEDLSENPFALSTPNEELYIDDPKKTLRGWFEREGYELEYDVEEKGFKTFVCRIQLPIDTPTGDFMPIEASVSGKKKEAVVACALEACRTLDRLGLLRQSHQESKQRKKKKWEENDYYDSDEDTFLDRTGTIEKKREMRKRGEKKVEAETFQSLEAKLKFVTDEINDITKKLAVSKNDIQPSNNTDDDTLEAYMSSLSDTKERACDKIERRKLKYKLIEAEKEKAHLEKLLEIAKPAKLPPVVKYPGIIGKRKKTKFQIPISKSDDIVCITQKLGENEEEIEEDSDPESIDTSKKESSAIDVVDKKVEENVKCYGLILKDNSVAAPKEDTEVIRIADEMPCQDSKFVSYLKESSLISKAEKPVNKPVEENISPPKKVKKDHKQVEQNIDIYTVGNAEYSTWVPPSGQTGDGITHLNAKYGY